MKRRRIHARINSETLQNRHNVLEHAGLRQLASVSYGSRGFPQAEGLKLDAGTLSGRLYTSEPYDFMDETVEADVQFSVAVPVTSRLVATSGPATPGPEAASVGCRRKPKCSIRFPLAGR